MSLHLLLCNYLNPFSALPCLSLSFSLSMSMSLSLTPPFCPWGWEGTGRISGRWCSAAATAWNILTSGLMGREQDRDKGSCCSEGISQRLLFIPEAFNFIFGERSFPATELWRSTFPALSSTCPWPRLNPWVWGTSQSLRFLATAPRGNRSQ